MRLPLVLVGRTRIFGRELRRSGIGRHLRVWRWLHIRRLGVEDRFRNQVGAGRLGSRDRNATRQAGVRIDHIQAMPAPAFRETAGVAERTPTAYLTEGRRWRSALRQEPPVRLTRRGDHRCVPTGRTRQTAGTSAFFHMGLHPVVPRRRADRSRDQGGAGAATCGCPSRRRRSSPNQRDECRLCEPLAHPPLVLGKTRRDLRDIPQAR
jgi:hypothetical protein